MRGADPASALHVRSRPRTTRSIAILAAVGALVLPACGGEEEVSRGEYERELQETATEIETAFAGVGSELRSVSAGSASLDRAVARVEAVREELEQQANELGEIAPPDDADEAHDELVGGLEEFADELGAFAEAVEAGDVRRLQEFAARLDHLEAVRRIEAATRELESQGYDVRG
jgi:hypothetical protein